MKTECTDRDLRFEGPGGREVVLRFDGGPITSDGGVPLISEVDRKVGALERFATCFRDHRDPLRIDHGVLEMVRQRVYGITAGYEDLNDHEHLRNDPLLCAVVGREDALAGKSTLNRLELSRPDSAASDRYRRIVLDPGKVDELLVDLFVEAHSAVPEEIVLDLDSTDDPIHGKQEGRCFHGYYDSYCYLPLYIFAGEHLLCARLRSSNIDGSAGSKEEVERIVEQIRRSWPTTRIILRADSGFCRDALMSWCEQNGVDFIFGLAKNERLVREIQYELGMAQMEYATTLKAARRFKELEYRTLDSWSRTRRVVAKAEYLAGKDNPRFVVTTLSQERIAARELYEDLYCARGDMENRIKEQQLDMFADRTSTATMLANQLRLYFSSMAYVLMSALRRLALQGTELAHAQCGTIRLRLFKIGARITISVRRVWVSLSQSWPWAELFVQVWRNIAAAPRPSS